MTILTNSLETMSFCPSSVLSLGVVEEAFICYEKGTHNSRGFGFVTFAMKADYDKCLENPVKQGDGFEIRCSPISLSKGDDRSRRYHK